MALANQEAVEKLLRGFGWTSDYISVEGIASEIDMVYRYEANSGPNKTTAELEEALRQLVEYGARLEAEVPVLVAKAILRGRKVPSVDAARVGAGVVAHSGSLPSFSAALEDARKALSPYGRYGG